mmetsp:Transcript_129509/g.415150  ORF Transcript_129509/g.415150 Transcript_129509/m.415150 type:complete len:200 (-) Transcript_129509:3257-3856(-)
MGHRSAGAGHDARFNLIRLRCFPAPRIWLAAASPKEGSSSFLLLARACRLLLLPWPLQALAGARRGFCLGLLGLLNIGRLGLRLLYARPVPLDQRRLQLVELLHPHGLNLLLLEGAQLGLLLIVLPHQLLDLLGGQRRYGHAHQVLEVLDGLGGGTLSRAASLLIRLLRIVVGGLVLVCLLAVALSLSIGLLLVALDVV